MYDRFESIVGVYIINISKDDSKIGFPRILNVNVIIDIAFMIIDVARRCFFSSFID